MTTRLPEAGEGEMAKTALRNTNTAAVRGELREVVHAFLDTLHGVPFRPVSASEEDLLVAAASLVCLARSPVERDPYRREIVYVHSPEGPARIARQLHKLLVALEAMGVHEPARLVTRAGLDSIPSPRRDVLTHLLRHGGQSTTGVAVALQLPRNSTERALEELAAHRLLSRRKAGDADNSANLWAPTAPAASHWTTLTRLGDA